MTRARIAIVGGGTVGLFVASRLAGIADVTVFEAAIPEGRAADLLLGAERALGSHDGSRSGWRSALGGTSTIWGGQLLPWEYWEFEGVGGPAWPIRWSEIQPHYAQVLRRLGASSRHDLLHGRAQLAGEYVALPSFHTRRSTWLSRVERDMSTNPSLRRGISAASVRAEHQVTRVEELRSGYRVWFETAEETSSEDFDQVILAAGTFGNVRALHAFFGGDRDDVVGTGFMDHVSARVASFDVTNWSRFREVAAQRRWGSVRTSVKYVTRPNFVRESGILPGYAHWELDLSESTLVAALTNSGQRPRFGASATELLQAVAAVAWSGFHPSRPLPAFAKPYLRVDVEQTPLAERRLTWREGGAGARGSLHIDWHISDLEIESTRKIADVAIKELQSAGIGAEVEERLETLIFTDTKHMMGGTVMGNSAGSSVVDTAGRVHGQKGLWVAGASVFPSGGVANPTFTALALADRMADVIAE